MTKLKNTFLNKTIFFSDAMFFFFEMTKSISRGNAMKVFQFLFSLRKLKKSENGFFPTSSKIEKICENKFQVAMKFSEVFWPEVSSFGVVSVDHNKRGQCYMYWNMVAASGGPLVGAGGGG